MAGMLQAAKMAGMTVKVVHNNCLVYSVEMGGTP
jgi:hypothetical protein